jgi:hypothetical protein
MAKPTLSKRFVYDHPSATSCCAGRLPLMEGLPGIDRLGRLVYERLVSIDRTVSLT